jgi:hypothetical protein
LCRLWYFGDDSVKHFSVGYEHGDRIERVTTLELKDLFNCPAVQSIGA